MNFHSNEIQPHFFGYTDIYMYILIRYICIYLYGMMGKLSFELGKYINNPDISIYLIYLAKLYFI